MPARPCDQPRAQQARDMSSALQRAQWAVPIAVQAAAMLRMIHENRRYIEMDMAYPHAEWVGQGRAGGGRRRE
jgi:hypothetical protein